MRPSAKSFRHINQALSFAAMRLQARAETRLLGQEIESARESLCVIEETFAELQQDHEQTIEAILQSEAQLREIIITLEESLLTTSTRHLLQPQPSRLLCVPKGRDRLVKARALLALLEDAPFSVGLYGHASKLRQGLFALEDAFRRHEAVLLARSNGLRERAKGLQRAQRLFQRLVLQTKLIFPQDPSLLTLEEHLLPLAA